MESITLFQFLASPYNEKVRWVLDLKRIPHKRISLLPGLHFLRIKRLTGQSQTPVLVDGECVVSDSSNIIAHLERRFPEPSLMPKNPACVERAVSLARRFDEVVGPAVRLAKFFEVLSSDYAVRVFCRARPLLVSTAYRLSFPFIKSLMMRKLRIDETSAAVARQEVTSALDFVADASAKTGYLIGERFTVADLTCAALLMPAVDVEIFGGPKRAGTTPEDDWLDRWSEHAGAEWVRDIYRKHRRS